MNTFNCAHLKTRPKVAALRRELAAVLRQLRYFKQHPAPTAHQIVAGAVRVGFGPPRPNRQARLTLASPSARSLAVKAPVYPSFQKIAPIYGVSRQRLGQLSVKYGRAVVADPDLLFTHLLQTCGMVLMRLADPTERARIKAELLTIKP